MVFCSVRPMNGGEKPSMSPGYPVNYVENSRTSLAASIVRRRSVSALGIKLRGTIKRGQQIATVEDVGIVPNVIDVYVRGMDNKLWQTFCDGSNWSS